MRHAHLAALKFAAPLLASVLPATALLASACPAVPSPDVECVTPADCSEPIAAPCDGCPTLAVELCVDGTCVARGEDAVDVSVATLLINRDVDGVNGIRFALVADATCDDALTLADGLNVLASGQKTLSGGDLHQDVVLGRVPEGRVTVALLGTSGGAGSGDVPASGCAEGLSAEAPTLVVEQIDLDP